MARAVQKVALKCEQANENGVLGKFLLKVSKNCLSNIPTQLILKLKPGSIASIKGKGILVFDVKLSLFS